MVLQPVVLGIMASRIFASLTPVIVTTRLSHARARVMPFEKFQEINHQATQRRLLLPKSHRFSERISTELLYNRRFSYGRLANSSSSPPSIENSSQSQTRPFSHDSLLFPLPQRTNLPTMKVLNIYQCPPFYHISSDPSIAAKCR